MSAVATIDMTAVNTILDGFVAGLPARIRTAFDAPLTSTGRREMMSSIELQAIRENVPIDEQLQVRDLWEQMDARQFRISCYLFWSMRK